MNKTDKTVEYHESAIKYNEGLMDFAEELAKDIEDEEVKRWSRSVAKQHRFHLGRHRNALTKLQAKSDPTPLQPGVATPLSVHQQQARFAAEMITKEEGANNE